MLPRGATATTSLTFLFFVPLIGSLCQAATPGVVGTVIEVRGRWTIAGRQEFLRTGEAVTAGGILKPEAARSGSFIGIALLNGNYLAMQCKDTDDTPCLRGLQVPTTYVEGASGVGRIVQTVMNVLLDRARSGGSPFSATIIRAGSASDRKELLVRYEKGEPTHLGTAVSTLPLAEYAIEWTKLDDQGSTLPAPVRWHSSREKPMLTLPGPGLYSVRFRNEYREIAADIALLAAAPDSYSRANASFEHARKVCAEWTGPEAINSAHEFLRAYLISLARNNEAQ
jgi:hypothetical protein